MSNPDAAKVEFKCTDCNARLRAAADKVGKKIRCAYCRSVIVVPSNAKPTQKRSKSQAGTSVASTPTRSAASATPAGVSTSRNVPRPGGTSSVMPPGAGTTKIELSSQRAEEFTVDASGSGISSASDTRRMQSRVHVIDHEGSASSAAEESAEASGEWIAVHEGPPVALPPRWASIVRGALGPDWRVWVPLSLIVGVGTARAFGDLEAVGGLIGCAAAMLLPVLWMIILRLLFRRPFVVSGRVTSTISLGDLRIVSVRWVTSAGPGGKPVDRQRMLWCTSRGANYARPDDLISIVLPSLKARRPAMIVPHHVAKLMEGGAAAPQPNEPLPYTPCPKCRASGRSSGTGLLARWVIRLVKFAILFNVIAAAIYGVMLLGSSAVVIGAVGAAGLLFWLADLWPPFGCDQCQGHGKLRRLLRPTVTGDLLVWVFVGWLVMAPFGWRLHQAWAELEPLDEVVTTFHDLGVVPGADLTQLDSQSLEKAERLATALNERVLAERAVTTGHPWLTRDRGGQVSPELRSALLELNQQFAAFAVRNERRRQRQLDRQIDVVRRYRESVRNWAAAVALASRWARKMHDARHLPPSDEARQQVEKLLADANTGLKVATDQLDAARAAIEPVRTLGDAGPTLWFGPESTRQGWVEDATIEAGRYLRAFFEPSRRLLDIGSPPIWTAQPHTP